MKRVVISLGGSVIIPNEVDYHYLKKFCKFIRRYSKKNKVVVITGGGNTARKYINPLVKLHAGDEAYSMVGVTATRLNARLLRGILKIESKFPENLEDVKSMIKRENLVVCGALGVKKGMTSDSNAAEIAKAIKADCFINITNVDGLYDKNPLTNKSSKLIPRISFEDFLKRALKIKYHAGQHFVLDQTASKIIRENRIKTFIVSKDIKNLKKVLNDKEFHGTLIQ